MKILVIADEESQKIWDFFRKEDYADIDLVISCGDLKADYLSFIATMIAVPVLYVHGNHDDKYKRKPPEGCICIEDTAFNTLLRITELLCFIASEWNCFPA